MKKLVSLLLTSLFLSSGIFAAEDIEDSFTVSGGNHPNLAFDLELDFDYTEAEDVEIVISKDGVEVWAYIYEAWGAGYYDEEEVEDTGVIDHNLTCFDEYGVEIEFTNLPDGDYDIYIYNYTSDEGEIILEFSDC